MKDHFYAVIMAGGGGTRLWPVSRQKTPKQLIQIFENRSPFQMAINRLDGFIPVKQIYVVTVADQVKLLHQQAPKLKKRNFLIEPQPRGTAAVVAMAAAAIHKQDPEAVLAILTADHMIKNIPRFRESLKDAQEIASSGFIVLLGINPTHPATGYGYIESGARIEQFAQKNAYHVKRFTEKPDSMRAEEFFQTPGMTWNSGMFISRADILLEEYHKFMPELSSILDDLAPYLGKDHLGQEFVQRWADIIPQTIDYGIIEKTSRTAVLKVEDLGWNDIGSWDSFFEIASADANGNIILESSHLGLDTQNSLVVSTDPNQLVVTLGVKDMIIIQTQDALLICPRGESQRVKDLVTYLKENQFTNFI